MAARLSHVFGGSDEATVEALADLVAELDEADDEHPDVSVRHESGWALSAFADGRVIWEHVEADAEVGQLTGLSRDEIVELFALLVTGDIAAVSSRPWTPRVV